MWQITAILIKYLNKSLRKPNFAERGRRKIRCFEVQSYGRFNLKSLYCIFSNKSNIRSNCKESDICNLMKKDYKDKWLHATKCPISYLPKEKQAKFITSAKEK